MEQEQRMTVKRLANMYGCTTKTAGKYIRQMIPHMEEPLSATMTAFREWEEKRMVFPVNTKESRKKEMIKKQTGRVIVPRHR